MNLGLDDTLHAVVQVTHEHGLPLRGVDVSPGRVQVFTEDPPWWVRWLTDPAAVDARCTVWVKGAGAEVAFHVAGCREGIEWTVVKSAPAALATAVLGGYGVTVTEQQLRVAPEAAVALADACASDASTHSEGVGRAARVVA